MSKLTEEKTPTLTELVERVVEKLIKMYDGKGIPKCCPVVDTRYLKAFLRQEFTTLAKAYALGCVEPTNNDDVREEFRKDWSVDIGNIQILNMVADWWLLKLAQAREDGRREERERIVKEYGDFNDGCGCCSDTSLKKELEALRK